MSFDKIIYRLTDKRIPAATGIGLVGEILERAGFQEQFRNVRSDNKRSRKQIDCGAIMTTFIGLLCMGKPDFDAIAEFQNDAAYYQTALHLTKGFPSSATLRQRMDEIGKTQREEILGFNTHLLKSNHVEPTALKNGMIPLDMDVTPMDNSNTKKEGVSFTYKKFMGYAPMMAYIGKEGYLVNTELREGKQHCQSGTPEFLRQTMNLCRKITDKPVLVRLDSGNDAAENVGILLENGAYYVIKRNLRKEDRNEWAENIRSWCKDIREPREGKKVYVGRGIKYFSRLGVAEFEIQASTIKKGDKLMVTGPTTGIVYFSADEIRYDLQPVEVAEQGQRVSMKVAEKIRPSDKLFKIVPAEEITKAPRELK